MKTRRIPALAALACLGASLIAAAAPAPAPAPAPAKAQTWDFQGKDIAPEWQREADARARPEAIAVKDGQVRITSRAKTWDRIKMTTVNRQFGPGSYSWRVFVPPMGKGDMASIGAFLYLDDKHELDFEIGPGTAAVRAQLKAAEGELVCYCTSQGFPYSTSTVKVKAKAWHLLTLNLASQPDGQLLLRWSIDGRQVKELKSQIPAATRFGIHCSVENLKFLGDHQPLQDHSAAFDRVSFTPEKAR